ncbi:unnamed protein product (macronuclear) [Paramecium tetraurelia]|uniref:Uncharacterized protein n=1 Tax=Paramecium tetraurelia TaxID=5888 RepID=A0DU39_PARTE|nr:uncharacterized protein GSPATT00020227001 [Paramecium tetraurelia]CAK86556.1 unnamed protein product [Paramecium tetraurelia]|eukprot:XP_001453953.1 hypothetical protein (macronuclear) [Paramecium tetraurelia strain d4-2]
MQYGKKGEDLSRSKIEILEDFARESVESLDSLLPQFHCHDLQQLEIERRVVAYLKSLGLKFKTDPTSKEHEFQQNFDQSSELPKQQGIVFQQTIGESPMINTIQIIKFGMDQSNSKRDSGTGLSPLHLGKQSSFEI